AFVESEMPLPGAGPDAAKALSEVAHRLVNAAGVAAAALRGAVRLACFGGDATTDSAPLAAVYESFWAATQDRFFALLPDNPAGGWEAALKPIAAPWQRFVKFTALRLFDEAAPLDPSAASCNPQRIVEARRNLFGTLDGRGPSRRRNAGNARQRWSRYETRSRRGRHRRAVVAQSATVLVDRRAQSQCGPGGSGTLAPRRHSRRDARPG